MNRNKGHDTEWELDTLICVYSDLWPAHISPIITPFWLLTRWQVVMMIWALMNIKLFEKREKTLLPLLFNAFYSTNSRKCQQICLTFRYVHSNWRGDTNMTSNASGESDL